jgi:ABC-type transporter Mla subunit MlaD
MRRFLLRNTDEWVGLLVVLAMIGFLAAILQAGVLREWFRPTSTLRIVLPEAGVAGLAVGGEVSDKQCLLCLFDGLIRPATVRT